MLIVYNKCKYIPNTADFLGMSLIAMWPVVMCYICTVYFIISPNEVFSDIMAEKYSTDLFQIVYEGRYPPRFVAIEIRYPPKSRTTAFAAKRHSYPPNLQNAISP